MTDYQLFYSVLALAFVVGICVGSFVTMASYRLPRGEDIVFKPSYCPTCAATLKARELVPLLSWCVQRGKCLHCRAKVSLRYPLSELTMGIIFTLLALFYGLTPDTLFYALLATALVILIVTDLEHFIIPDAIQLAVLLLGIAFAVYHGRPAAELVEGILCGLGLGLALHYGYLWLRKKDGLGWGDVKFLAVAGAWLPLAAFVPFLFFAGVLGTAFGIAWRIAGRGAVFPFGPALAVSLFITALFPGIIHLLLGGTL